MASRVGQYLLFETLGEGAFGKVKLGVHEETGEQVAVKIMDKSDIRAQEMTMNVRREIAIMKALKHKNIVNLRQVLTSSSKLYIVMDLVTGGELFTKILNEGKLEENVARSYFQQLVDGIEYCHRRGVCHRDLKPENLLIDETTGELKITDFGLSAMKGASTTEELLHTQCGSPNYCAPEIIARHRQGYNGAKVDAWSCGIILFALLAGFLPFYDENTKVLYRMIQRDDVKFPRKFPAEAKDLVLKLLHKEPDKRFTLAEVKKHPWFVVGYNGDNTTNTNSSPPSSSSAGRSGRRRRGHNRTKSSDTGPRSRSGSDAASQSSNAQPAAPTTPVSAPAQAPAPPPIPTPPRAPVQAPAPPVMATPPRVVPPAPAPPSSTVAPRAPAPPQVKAQPPPPPPIRAQPTQQLPTNSVPAPVPAPIKVQPPPPPAPQKTYAPPPPHAPPPPPPPVRTVVSDSPKIPPAPPLPLAPATAPVQAKSAVPVPPVVSRPIVPDAPVRHPPPVPPPVRNAQNTARASPQPVRRAPPPVPPPQMQKASPPPPVPPPMKKPIIENSPVGNTILADSRSGSLPEVEKDAFFQNPAALPAPSGSPVTSTSEGNVASLGSIPMAPKTELPMFGAPMPPVDHGRIETHATSSIPDEDHRQRLEKSPKPNQHAPRSDTSWQRRAGGSPDVRSGASPTVHAGGSPNVRNNRDTGPSLVPAGVPMSFVEQRRAMYNNLATGVPTAAAPLPDFSRGSSAPLDADHIAPKSNPLPDFTGGARVSIPRKVSAPNTASLQRKFEPLPMHPAAYAAPSPVSNGIAEKARLVPPAPPVASRVPPPAPPVMNRVVAPAPPAYSKPSPPAPPIGNKAMYSASNGTMDGEDKGDDSRAIRKKRTRAALARYRRIFRLGNNVGITGSPSFNSNHSKSKLPDDSNPDATAIAGSRQEFFARAKAVTGAWGVILTQELEEDSDSEDEDRQVTDEELAAFGKLLDFWDNRRASASSSQKGEIVLDDDSSTPLTEADISSIQSLIAKLEPKREDDVEEVAHEEVPVEVVENGIPTTEEPRSDEIRKLLERDFSNPSVDSGGGTQPASPRPRSVSNLDGGTAGSGLRMSASVDALSARMQQNPSNVASPKAAAGAAVPPVAPRPMPMVPAPNRGGGVFPTPPAYAPPDGAVSPPTRLQYTESTLRDPFRPKLPPQYPNQYPGPSGQNDSFPSVSTKARQEAQQLAGGRGAKIPTSISLDANLHTIANRKSSNEKPPIPRKPSSSKDLEKEATSSQGSLLGKKEGSTQSKHERTPSAQDTATRGMFAFSMFNRKKSSASSSFDASLPLDKCLVEVGRILQSLGCSVMMKRGESKMKCEAPVKNSEKMLVSVTCTHIAGKTKVVFKKGRKDRSRVDAKEFYEFFQTVYDKFIERVENEAA